MNGTNGTGRAAWEKRKAEILNGARCVCGKMGTRVDPYLGWLCGAPACHRNVAAIAAKGGTR
jgi:hypothetical protein